ncbi:hypothetical protein TRFO_42545 [Tritrichomonas foetus]|uniref:Protein kinase domain-containing protein n=1 Tax=Tritrichomonas foetus TaxID=1144522 RepID=A0A1J4L097_9EUKA|nr:hypothetical protein TRFO_42545 [Tritrichomonas foetus]|eukprot:OHT15356.1 hypothetical protein TRFO_42545 [Tritrichomonas foetus]
MSITDYIVSLHDFKLIRNISSGSISNQVYIVQKKEDVGVFVAKVYNKPLFTTSDQQKFLKQIEKLISKYQEHQSVLSIQGISLTDLEQKPNPTIITKFITKGSLRSVLDKIKEGKIDSDLTDSQKHIIMLGIAFGMKQLHGQNIIHNNLKPSNVLLDSNYYPIITEYGMSEIFDPDFGNSIEMMEVNKPIYISPEILNNRESCEENDVFAFSMICYELFCDELPIIHAETKEELIEKIQKGEKPNLSLIKNVKQCQFLNYLWEYYNSKKEKKKLTFSKIVEYLTKEDNFVFLKTDRNEIDSYAKRFNYKVTFQIPPKLFQMAVDGDPDACFKVGLLYYHGKNMPKNKKEAVIHFKVGADNGSIYCMYMFAKIVIDSKDEPNYSLAAKYTKIAADAGNCHSQGLYGLLLKFGMGVEQNMNLSVQYFKKAAEAGDTVGCYHYGRMLIYGEFVNYNFPLGWKLVRRASEKGSYNAIALMGIIILDRGNSSRYPEAIKYLRVAIKHKNPEAMFGLAEAYYHGKGVPKDFITALKLYKISAKMGYVPGMHVYAKMIKPDKNMEKEYVMYIKKAADLGYRDSMIEYSNLLRYGDCGVEKNIIEADRYLHGARHYDGRDDGCNIA